MGKVVGIQQFMAGNKPAMEFTGPWYELLGRPAPTGAWLIWGLSGSGKTSFACRLCKYLTRFGRVAYNSLEEGDSLSLQRSFEDVNMLEVSGRLVLLNQMPIDELSDRLAKRKSWDIILIDSLQYTGLTYADYRRLRQRHPDKLFIFTSHARGGNPDGQVATKVMYDAGCKIYVEGFRATARSRFLDKDQANHPYVIWPERAALYWGDRLHNNTQTTVTL